MANIQIAGESIYYKGNYDERLFQKLYVEKLQDRTHELIVVGSSRGMLLDSELLGVNDMCNNCVSGATIEDLCAIVALYYVNNTMPKRIVLNNSLGHKL